MRIKMVLLGCNIVMVAQLLLIIKLGRFRLRGNNNYQYYHGVNECNEKYN